MNTTNALAPNQRGEESVQTMFPAKLLIKRTRFNGKRLSTMLVMTIVYHSCSENTPPFSNEFYDDWLVINGDENLMSLFRVFQVAFPRVTMKFSMTKHGQTLWYDADGTPLPEVQLAQAN